MDREEREKVIQHISPLLESSKFKAFNVFQLSQYETEILDLKAKNIRGETRIAELEVRLKTLTERYDDLYLRDTNTNGDGTNRYEDLEQNSTTETELANRVVQLETKDRALEELSKENENLKNRVAELEAAGTCGEEGGDSTVHDTQASSHDDKLPVNDVPSGELDEVKAHLATLRVSPHSRKFILGRVSVAFITPGKVGLAYAVISNLQLSLEDHTPAVRDLPSMELDEQDFMARLATLRVSPRFMLDRVFVASIMPGKVGLAYVVISNLQLSLEDHTPAVRDLPSMELDEQDFKARLATLRTTRLLFATYRRWNWMNKTSRLVWPPFGLKPSAPLLPNPATSSSARGHPKRFGNETFQTQHTFDIPKLIPSGFTNIKFPRPPARLSQNSTSDGVVVISGQRVGPNVCRNCWSAEESPFLEGRKEGRK
ncbi:hypothetical protein C8F04DRAFT_1184301 [Mycena alexandri]|uniref:Uncharacterized protein n=1 Tax=Mycena alexandri TaxID=1745969 RepID=A0AAD6SSL4_9AGAR|nr:hypothetical protein C8F04DRAFT_1184301 [Mycena alexandri]